MTKKEELDAMPFAQSWSIKETIRAYGHTIVDVAEAMDITPMSLYKLQDSGWPSIRQLMRIAKVIGCNDLREFFSEPDGTWHEPIVSFATQDIEHPHEP